MVMYIDRSQETNQVKMPTRVRGAWVINAGCKWLGKSGMALENNVEIYNSKAIVLCKGLKTVLAISQMQNVYGIHICLNNLGVVQNTGLILNSSSQGIFQ